MVRLDITDKKCICSHLPRAICFPTNHIRRLNYCHIICNIHRDRLWTWKVSSKQNSMILITDRYLCNLPSPFTHSLTFQLNSCHCRLHTYRSNTRKTNGKLRIRILQKITPIQFVFPSAKITHYSRFFTHSFIGLFKNIILWTFSTTGANWTFIRFVFIVTVSC